MAPPILNRVKAYQNTKQNFQNMTFDVTMTSLLKLVISEGDFVNSLPVSQNVKNLK